jgi:hypothetical protein
MLAFVVFPRFTFFGTADDAGSAQTVIDETFSVAQTVVNGNWVTNAKDVTVVETYDYMSSAEGLIFTLDLFNGSYIFYDAGYYDSTSTATGTKVFDKTVLVSFDWTTESWDETFSVSEFGGTKEFISGGYIYETLFYSNGESLGQHHSIVTSNGATTVTDVTLDVNGISGTISVYYDDTLAYDFGIDNSNVRYTCVSFYDPGWLGLSTRGDTVSLNAAARPTDANVSVALPELPNVNYTAADKACQDVNGSFCFTAGTQIVVGVVYDENDVFVQYITINIEDIKVGDWVYSYDTLTGEVTQKQVTATFVRQSNHINYLTIEDEHGNIQVLEVTDGHPFWGVTDEPDMERSASGYSDGMYHGNLSPTENGFWVEAKDLRAGDVFIGANGELSTVVSNERVACPDGVTVYNFTVEGNHNYFVIAATDELGQTCVLVHNADYRVTGKLGKQIKNL